MFRNLFFGTLLAPIGAAFPVAAIFIGWGLLWGIVTLDTLVVWNGLAIAFYAFAGAFVFGWLTALLIGLGNGLVWIFVKESRRRLQLAALVGVLAVLIAFWWMAPKALSDTSTLLSLAMFALLGSIGSSFSASIIGRVSRIVRGAP